MPAPWRFQQPRIFARPGPGYGRSAGGRGRHQPSCPPSAGPRSKRRLTTPAGFPGRACQRGGVALAVGMILMPHSPRWLMERGRDDEARAVLARVHSRSEGIDSEMDDIRRVVAEEGACATSSAQRSGRC